MEITKKMRRCFKLNSSIAFVCVVVFVSCLLVVLMSIVSLPELSLESRNFGFISRIRKISKVERLDVLGQMMVEMLPDDLAFTVFVPSEKAFKRDLQLWANGSLAEEKANENTFATISRVLGFSAIPRSLLSVDVPLGKEITFDSISGFKLYISRESNGAIVTNRVPSELVDLRKGEIIVHIMDGVIMDPEFEQSVQPDYEGED